MSDLVRWCVIGICVFNVGTMGALFERVGRSFLPLVWMRLLMGANMLMLLVIALGSYERLGYPITYRTPLLLGCAIVEFISLLGIHRWYGTTEGIAHSARMMKGRVR